jgi:hypothetical protein
VGVGVTVGVGVRIGVGVGVGVGVGTGVGGSVSRGMGVGDAVGVGVGVWPIGDGVGVGVGVWPIGVGDGVGVTAGCTAIQAENSEVSRVVRLVAVAVICFPGAIVALVATAPAKSPLASVVITVEPISVCPSPFPLGSQVSFAKNWIRNWVDAALSSVNPTVRLPDTADVSSGKF